MGVYKVAFKSEGVVYVRAESQRALEAALTSEHLRNELYDAVAYMDDNEIPLPVVEPANRDAADLTLTFTPRLEYNDEIDEGDD